MELSPYTVKYMLTLRISVKIELLDTQVLGHPVGQRIWELIGMKEKLGFVCVYIHIYVYVCVYIYVYVRVYMCVCVCACL